MIDACVQANTDSANATLVVTTGAGYFCGANLAGGDGTLSIYAGAAKFLVLKTTANLDTVSFVPAVPVTISTAAGIVATMSGTGKVTICYAAIL